MYVNASASIAVRSQHPSVYRRHTTLRRCGANETNFSIIDDISGKTFHLEMRRFSNTQAQIACITKDYHTYTKVCIYIAYFWMLLIQKGAIWS